MNTEDWQGINFKNANPTISNNTFNFGSAKQITQSNPLKSILLLAANPKGTKNLRLQEEEREMKERLRLAGYGIVPINSAVAVRPRDIQQAMLDFKPQIVHFSGHGSGKAGLYFEDVTGKEKLISTEALANLFKIFSNQVECVVLNACYSELQAEAISHHIDYVIGMNDSINDQAAIEFTVGFYTALGAGESVEVAYDLGCNAIQLIGVSDYLIPIIFRKGVKLLHDIDKPVNSPFSGTSKSQQPSEIDDFQSEDGMYYASLRDMLKAGQWKQADQETSRLMYKLMGRENQWIAEEDVQYNFPCTDLKTIDRLWMKYSNGKFGFSVQKNIYLEMGNSIGQYNHKAFERFSDRVGWRRNRKWLYFYDTLTFDISAPDGHLPSKSVLTITRGWGNGGWGGLVSSEGRMLDTLFSRLETCELAGGEKLPKRPYNYGSDSQFPIL